MKKVVARVYDSLYDSKAELASKEKIIVTVFTLLVLFLTIALIAIGIF